VHGLTRLVFYTKLEVVSKYGSWILFGMERICVAMGGVNCGANVPKRATVIQIWKVKFQHIMKQH